MLHFINTRTMQYPVFEGQVKAEHNIDDALRYPHYEVPPEYAVVKMCAQPIYDKNTQAAELVTPTLINGDWVCTWEIRNLTKEEIERVKQFQAFHEAAKLEEEMLQKRREADPLSVFMLVHI